MSLTMNQIGDENEMVLGQTIPSRINYLKCINQFSGYHLEDIYKLLINEKKNSYSLNDLFAMLEYTYNDLSKWLPKNNSVFKELENLKKRMFEFAEVIKRGSKEECDTMDVFEKQLGNMIYSYLFIGI